MHRHVTYMRTSWLLLVWGDKKLVCPFWCAIGVEESLLLLDFVKFPNFKSYAQKIAKSLRLKA